MQMLHLLALDPIAETTGDKKTMAIAEKAQQRTPLKPASMNSRKATTHNGLRKAISRAASSRMTHEWFLAHIPMEKAIQENG